MSVTAFNRKRRELEEEKAALISQGYEVPEEVANEVFKEVEKVIKGKK